MMNKLLLVLTAVFALTMSTACGVQQGQQIDDPGQVEEQKNTTPLPPDPARIYFVSLKGVPTDPFEKLPDYKGWNIMFSYELNSPPPKDRGLNIEVYGRYLDNQPYLPTSPVMGLGDTQKGQFLLTEFPRNATGTVFYYRMFLRDNKQNILQVQDGWVILP